MESQPQNPEFRINPKNFHPCAYIQKHLSHFFSWKQNNMNPDQTAPKGV